MRSFLLFLPILFIGFVFWQLGSLYTSIQSDKEDGMLEQMNYVQEETGLTITNVERFHGDALYFIFTAYEPEQDEYSYLLLNNDQQVERILFSEIDTNQELIISKAKEKFPELREIKRVIPAYVHQQFAWEVSAYDQEQNLQYIYYSMKDGQYLKRYIVNILTK